MTTYTDTFTDADGTNLIGSAAPNGTVYGGVGSWTIQSNAAYSDASGRLLVADWGAPDATVSAVKQTSAAGTDCGLALRVDVTLTERIVVKHEGDTIYLQVYSGTSFLGPIGDFTVPSGASGLLEVAMAGADYTVSFDGTLLGTVTDTGANYLTNTYHGLYTENPHTFDNLTVSGVPGAPPPALTTAHLGLHGGMLDVSLPPAIVTAHLGLHGGEIAIVPVVHVNLAATGGSGRYPIGIR